MSAKKKTSTKRAPVRQVKAGAKGSARRGKKGSPAASPAILDALVERAKEAREQAYAPYSQYKVGAAIRAKSGKVYAGCNVENSTFGASICAERNAVVQMVAAGDREIEACAVVTGDEGASPCGICRQVLAEFAGDDVPVVMVGLGAEGGEAGRVVSLGTLLPLAFRLEKG